MRRSKSRISSNPKRSWADCIGSGVFAPDPARQAMTEISRIRACENGDAKLLALIGSATFLETYAHQISGSDIAAHCASQHGEEYYQQRLAEKHSQCWIAELAKTGAPIGYQVLTEPDLPIITGADDIELKRIYILSRFQGGGLGRHMIETALRSARGLACSRLLLGVYSENIAARGFYAKMGFEEVGERSFKVGSAQFHDKILARSL